MSAAHTDAFERIKVEHEEVIKALRLAALHSQGRLGHRKDRSSGSPLSRHDLLESAILTADDAYALLLIATAERFMRAYLRSVSVDLPSEPKFSNLIDQCVKQFNSCDPRIPIRSEYAADLHNLRAQRNEYAHGHGASVFPTIGRVAMMLGRFFKEFP
jgi:hypothetical protein